MFKGKFMLNHDESGTSSAEIVVDNIMWRKQAVRNNYGM